MDPVSATLLVTTIAAGVGGAVAQRNAGIAQSQQMKAEAVKEGDGARQREIERKRNLLRALSQQSANAGASGTTFGGSVAGIARADIRDATNDLLVDKSNTKSKQNALITGAKNARSQANLGAAVSLFDTGTKVAEQF